MTKLRAPGVGLCPYGDGGPRVSVDGLRTVSLPERSDSVVVPCRSS